MRFNESLVLYFTPGTQADFEGFRYLTNSNEACVGNGGEARLDRGGLGEVEIRVERGEEAEPIRWKEPIPIVVGEDGKIVQPPRDKGFMEKYWMSEKQSSPVYSQSRGYDVVKDFRSDTSSLNLPPLSLSQGELRRGDLKAFQFDELVGPAERTVVPILLSARDRAHGLTATERRVLIFNLDRGPDSTLEELMSRDWERVIAGSLSRPAPRLTSTLEGRASLRQLRQIAHGPPFEQQRSLNPPLTAQPTTSNMRPVFLAPFRPVCKRQLTTASRPTLSLASDSYAPSKPTRGGPVVILHGLYGSKQNWRSLAKGMANRLERDVHALDLRNHGESPHSPHATYRDMSGDVAAFLEERSLEDVTVIGHSMGGKVAMALALRPTPALSRLVVVDMAPGIGKISPEFGAYLKGMQEVTEAKVHSRKEADDILSKYESDLGVRQFLLTNLSRETSTSPYGFRLPLSYLQDALGEIGEFPYEVGAGTKWEGPALFIKGAKSKYINRKNIPLIKEFFPNMKLSTLEAGHWVHAERPKEFMDAVAEFCA
ncbi:hypothetical protein P7C70_g188, partial [Phenoliferia sp. Uapishka_3]